MRDLFHLFAESEGFKPPIPEEGIPDFESSAIVHSANSPLFRLQRYKEICKPPNYSNDNLDNFAFNASDCDLRMANRISQVLSKVWETMRGCMSFTMRITSFIMG